MKKIIIIVTLILVALGISYVATNWPLNSTKNTQGTLGGVQKVEKFRGKQLTGKDLAFDSPEVTKLTQSAKWQNAMKDENFVKMLKNGNFQKVMKYIYLSNSLALQAKGLNNLCQKEDLSKLSTEQFKEKYNFYCIPGQDMTNWWIQNLDYQKFRLKAADFQKNNRDNNDKNKVMSATLSFVFSNFPVYKSLYNNTALSGVMETISKNNNFFGPRVSTYINNISANELTNSDDFVKAITLNLDMEKFFSQDINKIVNAADFQKGFEVLGLQFQNANFQKLVNNADFQQMIFGLNANNFHTLMNSQAEMYGWQTPDWP